MRVDVLVIGSGFAGLVAAVEAAEAGASVLVVEKMRAAGGNSVISDGGFAALGEGDSTQRFYDDVLKAGQGRNNPALVRLLVDHAAEALEWSRALGVEYLERLETFGGHSVARCFTAKNRSGVSLLNPLLRRLKALGVPLRTQVQLKTLTTDATGTVTGAVLLEGYDHRDPSAGHLSTVEAGAVVLATGGFGADVAFRSRHDPRLTADVDTTNKPFATAEALTEAMRLGAATVDLGQIQLGPWASPDERGYGEAPGFADYTVFPRGLVVDPATGQRFCDERSDRKTLADALLAVGHPCLGVADADAVAATGWSLERALARGVVRSFATLDAVAEVYGLDREAWQETARLSGRLVTPPYYAVRLWPKVHYTMGGVAIDADAAVLDEGGRRLEGLFAAGEVVGGVHGACRLGSCSITECFVFGRLAGRSAQKFAARRGGV